MRVLLVKLSSLGDVIHTLPALTDARAAHPDLRVDWVVEEAFAEVPGWHPAVEEVVPVALRRWRRRPLRSLLGDEWRAARGALGARRYDAVIDAQGLLKSALLLRYTRGPRFGFDRDSAREGLASRAYTHPLPVPRDRHAIERLRRLFAAALRYPLPVRPVDYGLDLPRAIPGAGPIAFLHGTSRREKLWPESHWIDLARRAVAAGRGVWLPWGSEAERERAGRIAAAVPGGQVERLPRLTLTALAGHLARCSAAVAVDTGPGHLCAALGLPGVSLYGPTRPALVGTCGGHQRHLRAGPGAGMETISPQAVWRAVEELPGERG